MINNTATYGDNKSGLITGTQWDTIMKWYENAGIGVGFYQGWGTYWDLAYIIPGTTEKPSLWFNSNSSRTWTSSTSNVSHAEKNGGYYHASGLNENGIKKNIADLGGNVSEWTAEKQSKYPVHRGDTASNSTQNVSAAYRSDSTGSAYYDRGFRVVLYIQ